MTALSNLIARNRSGENAAIPSVCTAHPDAIAAALLLAKSVNRYLLIEATSNQVNQFGGYTGMKPADFISFVHDIANQHDVDVGLIEFGGDHLGPQVWRAQPAVEAMAHACELMRAYVEAGFTKIHLDCSEGCQGEPAQVDDKTSAERAAKLAATCEAHAPDPSRLTYVIGTEVPPPGGARADEGDILIKPTTPEHARHTIACHREAFEAEGILSIWSRVLGLVVQPGLEFAAMHIDRLDLSSENNLPAALDDEPTICFEAHSTDYQYDEVFIDLARRNFCVLKVGPALTFAYRQALYGLDHVRAQLLPNHDGRTVYAEMERLMLESPQNWEKHYAADKDERRLQRHFGYADRIRYYWAQPEAQAVVGSLLADLSTQAVPPRPLLEQYFAPEMLIRADGLSESTSSWAQALLFAQVQTALAPYFFGDD